MSQVDYEINKELGECYLFMGEYDKARDYYLKAVSCDATVAEPYLGLAAIAVSKGALDDAYALYKKANQVESNEKTLTGLGMIEVEQGKYADGFTHFTAALDINPGNMMVVNSMLQLAHMLNRLQEAVPYLEAALDTGDVEAVRFALAACLLSLGRNDDAKIHLELLLGEFPTNENARELYAQIAA